MEEITYQMMALALLALFYAAYLLKMARQASRGIKTNQVGSRQGETHAVEVTMGIATVAVIVAQALSIAFDWTWTAGWIRIVGFAIGLAGCAFFIAATIGLKDSWRAGIPKEDETEFVTDGIYSWSRNPEVVGSNPAPATKNNSGSDNRKRLSDLLFYCPKPF